MKDIGRLQDIKDRNDRDNIMEMMRCFVSAVDPLKVILFGSFASGNYTDESDFDFYLVIDDGRNVLDATDLAYNSVLFVKKRPVDIVVGTASRFEVWSRATNTLMIEREVWLKGILLYERTECDTEYSSQK